MTAQALRFHQATVSESCPISSVTSPTVSPRKKGPDISEAHRLRSHERSGTIWKRLAERLLSVGPEPPNRSASQQNPIRETSGVVRAPGQRLPDGRNSNDQRGKLKQLVCLRRGSLIFS
jgi:hypothetical protein